MTLVAAAPPIPGLQFWVVVWYLILALGFMGLVGAVMWRRSGRWDNRDEILRGVGTVAVSLGMLLLLYGLNQRLGQAMIAVAVGSFVLALRQRRPRRAFLSLIQGEDTPSRAGSLDAARSRPIVG